MRGYLLIIAAILALGLILTASATDFDAAVGLQGHRIGGIAAGFACVAVFFVLAVGAFLFLAR